MSDQQTPAPNWQTEQIYESGKGRQYKLLFTVNGGAYVLIGFLVDKADALKLSPIGVWAFVGYPTGSGILHMADARRH